MRYVKRNTSVSDPPGAKRRSTSAGSLASQRAASFSAPRARPGYLFGRIIGPEPIQNVIRQLMATRKYRAARRRFGKSEDAAHREESTRIPRVRQPRQPCSPTRRRAPGEMADAAPLALPDRGPRFPPLALALPPRPHYTSAPKWQIKASE